MAVKIPPIKKSHLIFVLQFLLGLLSGNALPPLPLVGDVLEESPVCPQTVTTPGLAPTSSVDVVPASPAPTP